jgi:hypothetical protein
MITINVKASGSGPGSADRIIKLGAQAVRAITSGDEHLAIGQ